MSGGAPEDSTGSGSGFKASQKTGPRLKVSSDRLREAGNRTCDPWFTRHRRIYMYVKICEEEYIHTCNFMLKYFAYIDIYVNLQITGKWPFIFLK